MEFLIVLVFMAIPVIAMFKGKKKVDVKFQPLTREILDMEPEQESILEERGSTLHNGKKPAEAKPSAKREPVAVPVQSPLAVEDEPQGTGLKLTDEEKRKMIIYSEILKPKYEE